MKTQLCSSFWCLIIFVFLFAGCNNQDRSNGSNTADATSSNEPGTNKHTPFDETKGVTEISPDKYKLLADTLNMRILEGTYKPGDSSIMHAHPDFALYVLNGSTVELTAEDGNKQNIEFTKDMAVILPAATHSAKNVGKTTLKLVVLEVDRPRE